MYGGVRVVVLSMEIPLPVVERAIEAAAELGVTTLLNLSPVADVPDATLAALDVLLVNEHEAAWLLGGETLGNPGALLELGPKAAVVTVGARGALVVTAEGVREVPSPKVEAVDTTGAVTRSRVRWPPRSRVVRPSWTRRRGRSRSRPSR